MTVTTRQSYEPRADLRDVWQWLHKEIGLQRRGPDRPGRLTVNELEGRFGAGIVAAIMDDDGRRSARWAKSGSSSQSDQPVILVAYELVPLPTWVSGSGASGMAYTSPAGLVDPRRVEDRLWAVDREGPADVRPTDFLRIHYPVIG